MGFVCTAAGENSQADLIGGTIIVPIGYDDTFPKSYSVLAGLSPTGGGIDEFFVCIVEANTEDRTEIEYWSGLQTRDLFAPSERKAVLDTIVFAIKALLEKLQPEGFLCCTHDADSPEKALVKYCRFAETFKMCGYAVQGLPVRLGKYSWWMERKT
jgi:hypothetical protein